MNLGSIRCAGYRLSRQEEFLSSSPWTSNHVGRQKKEEESISEKSPLIVRKLLWLDFLCRRVFKGLKFNSRGESWISRHHKFITCGGWMILFYDSMMEDSMWFPEYSKLKHREERRNNKVFNYFFFFEFFRGRWTVAYRRRNAAFDRRCSGSEQGKFAVPRAPALTAV